MADIAHPSTRYEGDETAADEQGSAITCMQLSPTYAVAGSIDAKVKLVGCTGEPIHTLPEYLRSITASSYS